MAPPSLNLKYVVSFSSQDDIHRVNNVVENDGFRKWLSHSKDKSGQIEAVFQLQEECIIATIEIGLIWCAMVEIQVGHSDWPQGTSYKTLVPTASVMSPVDCRKGTNNIKSRTFGEDYFSQEVAKGCWDRVRVICRQPFRKDLQYGLSFLRIKASKKGKNKSEDKKHTSVKSIHKHFFGKTLKTDEKPDLLKSRLLKIAGSGENGTEQNHSLSRTAKLVMAASSSPATKNIPPVTSPPNASGLHSNHLAQKYGPLFEKEVGDFLCDYNIDVSQLDKLTIADIRHKFEKIKKRKLTPEEKKMFISLTREYICVLFAGSDDSIDETSKTNTSNNDSITSRTSGNDNKKNKNVETKSNDSLTENKKDCKLKKARSTSNFEGRKATPLSPNSSAICRNSVTSPETIVKNKHVEDLSLKRKLVKHNSQSLNPISPLGKSPIKLSPKIEAKRKLKSSPSTKWGIQNSSPTNDQWLNKLDSPKPVNERTPILGSRGRKRSLNDSLDERMAKSPKTDNSVISGNGKTIGRGRDPVSLREVVPTSFERCSECKDSFPKEALSRHRLVCPSRNSSNTGHSINQSWSSVYSNQSAGGFLQTGYYSERNNNNSNDSDDLVYRGTAEFSDQYVECPLCGEYFRQRVVERHAATCCV